MRTVSRLWWVVLGLVLGSHTASAEPVVLELFTSQGCSSCPPAEAYLQELAKDPEAVVLAYHVDYWDNLGWQDPFASTENTQRQRAYHDNGRVFTPELRINGTASLVGSDRRAVQTALREAQPLLPLSATRTTQGWQVALPKLPPNTEAYLMRVKAQGETPVTAGENSGQMLREINIVTAIQPVHLETATSLQLPTVALKADEHAVLLLQTAGQGPVLAAAVLP